MISCEGKDSEIDMVTPPKKKLKQARLSFHKISPGVDPHSPKITKKRKISDDSGDSSDIQILKVVKTNVNSNLVSYKNFATKVTSQDTPVPNGSSHKIGPVKENDNSKSEPNKHLKHEQMEEKNISGNLSLNPSEEDVHKSTSTSPTEITSGSSESDDVDTDNDSVLNGTAEDFNSSGSLVIDSAIPVNDSTSQQDTTAVLSSDTLDKSLRDDSICSLKSSVLGNKSTEKKKLTPKQILRRQEIEKRREEKEKLKKEKEEMKAIEKEVKRKVQLEKREKKQKEKEEKEEQRRKEKEEKEKKKQAELELKSEEKRMKEEEKRKKEEQKVLEKKKKTADKGAKKKEVLAFANFFVATKGAMKPSEDIRIDIDNNFMPFQVKGDMRLAPILRTNFTEGQAEDLDKLMKRQSETQLYLKQLRRKNFVAGCYKKTWPLSEFTESVTQDEDDVIFVSEENKVMESHPSVKLPKAKLLLFCENRRPPYWGTWRKKSSCIKPTKPFMKDEKFFDYEVYSDDEWEEEEPGESLHGSDDEKESEDEYEVDHEFFVPHGYLSEEENDGEEEEEDVMSPETMKAKLRLLEMEFEEEMKHKTERLKPRLFGCFWQNENSNVDPKILGILSSYRAVCREMPIPLCETPDPDSNSPVCESQCSGGTPGSSKRKKFPESMIPELIKLVHGNINGRSFLVKEFSAYLKCKSNSTKDEQSVTVNNGENTPATGIVSKLSISNKIKVIASWIACPEEGPFLNRMCWYVSAEIRSAYGLEDLVIPNKAWNYIITPKRELELSNTIPSPSVNFELKQKSLPLITKFTKKISQGECQKPIMSSQADDGDIEILNETKVSTPRSVSGKISREKPVSKNTHATTNSESTSVKDQSTASAKNGSGDSNGRRQKLLQFKAKQSGTPVQCKRVPILLSVPLGQKIVPASVTSTENKSKESEEKVLENRV